MSAPTMPKLGPELTLALEIGEAGKTDPRKALTMATRAVNRFPNFQIPAGSGRTVTFAQLRDHFQGEVGKLDAELAKHATTEESAQQPAAPKAAPSPKKRAPRKAAPKAAPQVESVVKAEPTVLTLVHDGVQQTAIFGIEKGSVANRIIGSAKREYDGVPGLGWWFFPGNESFYIPGSQGYAPDYKKINLAISRLESARDEQGNQLYKVDAKIVTEVDGKALPGRKSREEMREWQQAYTAAQNLASWEISMGSAECVTCLADGLGERVAQITKSANGMPQVECATCAGVAVAEPVVLALPAAPEPVKAEVAESAECPLCKATVKVTKGKLALHTFNGGACRGKLGVAVVDVEPEAAEVKTTRKAAPKPAPKIEEPVVEGSGLVIKIQIQRSLSRTKQGDVATGMRQAIAKSVTRKGMDIEVRRDKSTGVATITVIEAAGADARELESKILGAVKSVPGYSNRVGA